MRKYLIIILFPIVLVFGFLGGIFWNKDSTLCVKKFTYINPDFGCDKKQVLDKSNLITLREELLSFIESAKESGKANIVAIYFRDLHDGPILGINENDTFIGASLLKLPTALTFYKMSEEGNDILKRRLHYEGVLTDAQSLEQHFKPALTIKPGDSYSVEELIFHSLVYSDNMSHDVLKAALKSTESDRDLIFRTFQDLGLMVPKSLATPDISTRGYASIFRILYNASYLSVEHSDKILSMLSESQFDSGISAGVPKGIIVANKFGERLLGDDRQLHDCGIVYYPDNAYLLCVMTRGKDFDELSTIIGTISDMVYKEVDSRRISPK